MNLRSVTLASALLVSLMLGGTACGDSGDPGDSSDASTSDAGSPDGSTAGDDCKTACTEGSGGPPVNDCLTVDGTERCVYTCSSDSMCEEPYYSGCTAAADDGTTICEIAP